MATLDRAETQVTPKQSGETQLYQSWQPCCIYLVSLQQLVRDETRKILSFSPRISFPSVTDLAFKEELFFLGLMDVSLFTSLCDPSSLLSRSTGSTSRPRGGLGGRLDQDLQHKEATNGFRFSVCTDIKSKESIIFHRHRGHTTGALAPTPNDLSSSIVEI